VSPCPFPPWAGAHLCGAIVNRDQDGAQALFYAALRGDLDVMRVRCR
jgi:hypothetical protein